ncbi:FMN-linked oxidoreductase [Rhizodiscina lignyota]|uniref:FMN-linked oxidoreductase n=1 Tax=Rhizodiscina lignyota TaxID=1504668 RepID=A0A9P4M898_9PEZI|nr:FMN-linked oxidoreductase [Rhizodiscina lignyota]
MTEIFPSKRVPIPRNGVDYRGKVVLAPMVRSGELPSRLLALRYGADLVWGPETIDRAMIGTTRRINPRTNTVEFTRLSSNGLKNPALNPDQRESIIYRIHPELERGKLIYQIGTANPETAVQAATLVAGDVAGIDVNAGCPKPFSTSGGMGAALLRTPDKLCSILEALVKEVGQVFEIGISVKIRLLETSEKTEALVRKLVATGITGLTIHCRTTPMRPRERAIRQQLRMIASVCREAGVACVMNGDVEDREQALQLIQEYGVDGAMLATAAEKNPSVFRSKEQGGKLPWFVVSQEYFRMALSVENRWGNTKFLLAQHMMGKDPKYQAMNQGKGYEDCAMALEMHDLREEAANLDEVLGITNRQPRAEKRARAREFTAQMELAPPKKAKQDNVLQILNIPHDAPAVAV